MSIKINKLRSGAFFLIVTAFLSMITVFAQQGIGTSQIIVNPTTINVNQGASTTINYTVKLASGNIWGTDISVVNESALSSEGITVSFSVNGQDPNFSGVATITTTKATKSGSYNLQFIATGDDPTTSATTFTLVVNGKTTIANSTNTTSANTNQTNTTQGNNTTKTNPTTVNTVPYVTSNQNSSGYNVQNNYPSTSNQYPMYISIIAVIILFAVIIIRLKTL